MVSFTLNLMTGAFCAFPQSELVIGIFGKLLYLKLIHCLLISVPEKNLSYLREQVWWKDLSKDVYSFCNSCTTCKRSKPSNQKPYELLNPLPVPMQPWEAIGIDFIGLLALSKDRNGAYDSITIVIDLLMGIVHLTPSHTNYTAQQVAELVFAEVYKHHGIPRAIISD